jgi:hypothetical protein
MKIYVRASNARKVGHLIELEVADAPSLTADQLTAMNQLFPNLRHKAEQLLDQEQHFAIIPDDAEIQVAIDSTLPPTDHDAKRVGKFKN